MKKLYLSLLVLLPLAIQAQPPGYYAAAAGLSGEPLRIALKGIIKPHTALTYTPGLWNAYYTTDKKSNGKVWDIYSDRPGGTPAYEYTLGTDQCSGSSPSAENACYNREHTWPQSKFSSTAPMQTDLFIVYPTDYYVNNRRGDLPYGKVGTATQTFTNGSKIGLNTYPGAPGSNCFEPIDSFKGDLARTYFYVSTCYRDDSATFINWEMASQVKLNPWAAQMLLEWHHNDPVSKKEIDRNNAAYALQVNRNPFIDHPEYADCIWGTGTCSTNSVFDLTMRQHETEIYPNPATDRLNINLPELKTAGSVTVKLLSINGAVVYLQDVVSTGGSPVSIPLMHFVPGMYFVQVTTNAGVVTRKVMIQ